MFGVGIPEFAWLIIFILGLYLAILALLMPFFVYRIRGEARRMNRTLTTISFLLQNPPKETPNGRIITIKGIDNLLNLDDGVYEHSSSGARFAGSTSYDETKDRWIINLDG